LGEGFEVFVIIGVSLCGDGEVTRQARA
jgi:hypothetical protein